MRRRAHDPTEGEAGFTLPELLVAMTIMLVVLGAAVGLLGVTNRLQPKISSDNAKIQDAQISMERMARDLRQTYAVVSATPTSLTVNTFIPRVTACAGTTLGPARSCKVVYSCSAGACTRTVSELAGTGAGPATTVVEGLGSNSVFSYSPSSTAPTALTITFTLPREPGSTEDAITITDGVTMRNISGAVGT